MLKLSPEDLTVTSFAIAGNEDTIMMPPICQSVSRCMDECDSSACSDPEPVEP